jgi:hypothetical protein
MGPEGLLIGLLGTLDLTGLFYNRSLTCLSVWVEHFYNSQGKLREMGPEGSLIELIRTLDFSKNVLSS